MEKLIHEFDLNKYDQLFVSMGFEKTYDSNNDKSSHYKRRHYEEVRRISYSKGSDNSISINATTPFKDKNKYFFATIQINQGLYTIGCDWYPAKLEFINGQLKTVTYYYNGNLFRPDGGPVRETYDNGKLIVQEWLKEEKKNYYNNKIQYYDRFDGPCIIDEHGEHYYMNRSKCSKDAYCKTIKAIKDQTIVNRARAINKDNMKWMEQVAKFYNSQEVLDFIEGIKLVNKLEEANNY